MVIDALGRQVDLVAQPQRIVSLVPSLTEYLIFLGVGGRLVGRTQYCVAPAADVEAIPALGGTKNPDCQAIKELQPDLVIANKEENKARDVQALEEAGLPVYVTDITSVGEAVDALTTLARLVGATKAAQPLLNAVQTEISHAPLRCVRVAAFIWRDPWMLVGPDTYAADLLRLSGATNIAHAFAGRYPRIELDQLERLHPDLILLPDEPYAFSSADIPELAAYADRVVCCDGALLTWYGPRLPQALRTFRDLLCEQQAA